MSRMTAVTAPEYSDVHAETRFELDPTGGKYPRDASSLEEPAIEGASSTDVERANSSAELGAASPRPKTSKAPNRIASVSASELKAMSDEELLAGLRDQSEPHFAEIYNRYFQRIYSFVYTRMRNHAESEEVVQETFLSVFRSFDRYRGQSSLLSWIYGIAKNTTNSSIRRARSLNERIDLADQEDLMPQASLYAGTPADQLDLHRFRDQLTQSLESLADWQTEIFEMRHFENLSIPEISRRTTRSSDAVRSSLYRVKRLFFEAAEASHASGFVVGDQS